MMHKRSYLTNQIRNGDALVSSVVSLRLVDARERSHGPSDRFKELTLPLILCSLSRRVVPVPAVVLDGNQSIGEREVNIELIDREQRNRIQIDGDESRHDHGFIATEDGASLFRLGTFAQIVMRSLRSTDTTRRFRHECGALIRRQGMTLRGVAVVGAIDRSTPNLPVGASVFTAALLARLRDVRRWLTGHRITSLGQGCLEVVGRGSKFPLVTPMISRRQAPLNVSPIIPDVYGSLAISPVLQDW
jgi:hypothetical protein